MRVAGGLHAVERAPQLGGLAAGVHGHLGAAARRCDQRDVARGLAGGGPRVAGHQFALEVQPGRLPVF